MSLVPASVNSMHNRVAGELVSICYLVPKCLRCMSLSDEQHEKAECVCFSCVPFALHQDYKGPEVLYLNFFWSPGLGPLDLFNTTVA